MPGEPAAAPARAAAMVSAGRDDASRAVAFPEVAVPAGPRLLSAASQAGLQAAPPAAATASPLVASSRRSRAVRLPAASPAGPPPET